MKILPINNSTNPFKLVNNSKPRHSNFIMSKLSLGADIVSFSAKKYDIDDIKNPTHHCAYCGCKVYDLNQINFIAMEILQLKSSRLESKIKSILEKLGGAKNAKDIALAKRLKNSEQIDFFEKFLDTVKKNSFLKGEAIFKKIYNLDKDKAAELLIENMTPLQRTVDHVSPKNENKDNYNSDVNLVEACRCCNHDLKHGAAFSDFYTLFPSIKNNMPSDKFNYAVSSVLDFSQASVMQRISAQKLLKNIESLFTQRTEAVNFLNSINYRIKNCQMLIQNSAADCRSEIAEKQAEIDMLKEKLNQLMQDPEFVALLNRNTLVDKLNTQKKTLDSLRFQYQKTSNAINGIRNPSKNKKSKSKMSEKEKEEKIKALKQILTELSKQISEQEDAFAATGLEIAESDEKFPTIDILQHEKNKAVAVAKAHEALAAENAALDRKETDKRNLEQQKAQLTVQIDNLPKNSEVFDISVYSQEEQALYSHYVDLVKAVKYIDEHSNSSNIKNIIKTSDKKALLSEIQELEQQSIIIHYLSSIHRKNLEQQLQQVRKSIETLSASIEESKRNREKYEHDSAPMSYKDALSKIAALSEKIRQLNEKNALVKIPQRINNISIEIKLLENTVNELIEKSQEIDSFFNATV